MWFPTQTNTLYIVKNALDINMNKNNNLTGVIKKLRINLFVIISALLVVKSFAQFGDRVDCGMVENDAIKEASGIAASRASAGVLWVHNDAGDKNRIFAMNEKGVNLGDFYLENCEARDCEDIAAGPGPVNGKSYIYVGDIGDNKAKHKIKYVYRFIEPVLLPDDSMKNHFVPNVDILRFRYPDGNRDAEALMVDPLTNDFYVISKRDLNVKVYKARYPQPLDSVSTLLCIDTLNISMVVAADISPSGLEIIMKNYHEIYYWKRAPGESVKKALSRTPKKLPYIKEPQGEAVAWDGNGDGYFTVSEEDGVVPCHLYFYPRLKK